MCVYKWPCARGAPKKLSTFLTHLKSVRMQVHELPVRVIDVDFDAGKMTCHPEGLFEKITWEVRFRLKQFKIASIGGDTEGGDGGHDTDEDDESEDGNRIQLTAKRMILCIGNGWRTRKDVVDREELLFPEDGKKIVKCLGNIT